MPKYTPTHQRLQLRAAMQMAGYATLETSVKQHINEMIHDLRKECETKQIATTCVISALHATQKQHIKELLELRAILKKYEYALAEGAIAARAARSVPQAAVSYTCESTKMHCHYGDTAGAATTDYKYNAANELVRIIAHNKKIALGQKPEYIVHYGARYDVESFSVYFNGTEVGSDFKYLVGLLTAQMHATVREHNFKVTRAEFPLAVWDHARSWAQMYECSAKKDVLIIGNIPEVCYMYESIGWKTPVQLLAHSDVSDSDVSSVSASDVSSDTGTVRAHWTAIYNNVVDSDED